MNKDSDYHWEHPSLSHEIQTLLKNNNDPSESAVSQIREFLCGPRGELESLNASIQDLEKRLETLKIQRSKVQDTITRYSTILSPIRRIPVDVLSEIFLHCLPTHRYPFLKSTDAPVLLTRICSNWRTVALSTPRIWAQIHITFTDHDRQLESIAPDLHEYQQSHPVVYTVQEATEILRLRCNVVEKWLTRSGTCPLSISLHYTSHVYWGDLSLLGASDITIQLFCILSNFSHRWRALDLRIPLEVFREFRKMLIPSDLSMLTSLKTSFTGSTNGDVDFLNVQNLERITMAGVTSETTWRTFDLDITQKWTRLTDFFSYAPLSLDQVITVFGNFPNIVRSVVVIKGFQRYLPGDPPGQQVQLRLPHLRDLCIVDYLDPLALGNFYDCIDAPNLKWVDYTIRNTAYRIDSDAGETNPPPITALLRKATGLTRLVLNTGDLTAENMRQIFKSATHVTHLIIGPDLRTGKNALHRSSSNITRKYHWNLVDLGIMNDVEGTSASAENSTKPTTALLPRLEMLEVSDGMQIHIPDEILLQFILGRMDPSSPQGPAVLKKVHIQFNRLKEKDIVEDVFRQAKLVGAHIELNLDYIKEDDEGLKTQYEALNINPGYGFSFDDSSARFWDQDVMDDEVV